MNIKDYLAIRRSYEMVRHGTTRNKRLTFDEFAILCHLKRAEFGLSPSDIAEYQNVSRPTITHRIKRLVGLNLIDRFEDIRDLRCAVLKITVDGWCSALKLSMACSDVLRSAAAFGLNQGTVSMSTDRLIAKHYIARYGNILTLTDEGRDGAERYVRRIETIPNSAWSPLKT